jgi:hypothetical protein
VVNFIVRLAGHYRLEVLIQTRIHPISLIMPVEEQQNLLANRGVGRAGPRVFPTTKWLCDWSEVSMGCLDSKVSNAGHRRFSARASFVATQAIAVTKG